MKYTDLLTLAAATFLVGAGAVPASAQDRPERDERVWPALPFASTLIPRAPQRALLGVIVSVDQPTRYDESGARLTGVVRDGPAWEAGLREGDIVVAIDGQRLLDRLDDASEERFDLDESLPAQRLLAIVGELGAGMEVEIEYLRDREIHTTSLITEEIVARSRAREARDRSYRIVSGIAADRSFFRLDRTWECPTGGRSFVSDQGGCMLGTEVREIGEELGAYFQMEEGGLLVMEASEENLPGLRAGDVIVEIGGREVASFRRLIRLVEAYEPGETLELTVLREGNRTTLEAVLN